MKKEFVTYSEAFKSLFSILPKKAISHKLTGNGRETDESHIP